MHSMYRFVFIIGVFFFIFLLRIIFLANTGGQSIFFQLVGGIPYGDKLGHFGLFSLLTFFLVFGSKFKTLLFGRFRIYYGTLMVLTFAFFEEFSQILISSRTFEPADLLADLLGILVATYFLKYLQVKLKKPTSINL